MKQKTKIILIIVAAVVAIAGFAAYYANYAANKNAMDSYEKCAAAGYPILDSYPEQCVTPDGKTFRRKLPDNTQISLEGRIVCLQHRNTDGPQTLECATGLQTADNKYYSLVYDQSHMSVISAGSSNQVRVNGMLATETDDKYLSEGKITVSNAEIVE